MSAEKPAENSAPPPEDTRYVNKGLRAPAFCPDDPQAYLEKTNHPYAPFTGNALKWESWVYDDGTTYEGLTREEVPHGMGTVTFGNGYALGIQKPQRGDSYEGEVYAGFAHGLGMFTSHKSGEAYRGEFVAGKKQGCGMLMNFKPYIKLLEKGNDPYEAWEKSKEKIMSSAKYGTWKKDYFVAEPEESGRFCHINEIKGTLEELEGVLVKARMFQHKPDGSATAHRAQDASGKPIMGLMQDPLHYPYGTGFMAPGPAGQCHPIPDDPKIKSAMIAHAKNFQFIYNMYNFEYDPKPGSDMWKAERWWKKEQEKKRIEKEKYYEKQERRKRMLERRHQGDAGVGEETTVADSNSGPPRVLASLSFQLGRGVGQMLRAIDSAAFKPRQRLARPTRSEQ